MYLDPEKTLCCPFNDDSPHIDHWTKANMGINNCIFLKDSKPTFFQPPSQSWWLIDITTAQHMWRSVKGAGFKYFYTQNLNQDPLENSYGATYLFILQFQ
jgi:hypothetical protein